MFDISESDLSIWLFVRLTRDGYSPTVVSRNNLNAGVRADLCGCDQVVSMAGILASIRSVDA
jgi:hypothetical protein